MSFDMSTPEETLIGKPKEMGCMDKFMICLGVMKDPNKNNRN